MIDLHLLQSAASFTLHSLFTLTINPCERPIQCSILSTSVSRTSETIFVGVSKHCARLFVWTPNNIPTILATLLRSMFVYGSYRTCTHYTRAISSPYLKVTCPNPPTLLPLRSMSLHSISLHSSQCPSAQTPCPFTLSKPTLVSL